MTRLKHRYTHGSHSHASSHKRPLCSHLTWGNPDYTDELHPRTRIKTGAPSPHRAESTTQLILRVLEGACRATGASTVPATWTSFASAGFEGMVALALGLSGQEERVSSGWCT